MGPLCNFFFPGRLLYDVHLDKWTIRIFSRDSSAWVTYLGCYKVPHMGTWKEKKTLSLFTALLQGHSFCISLYTDWHGICSCCSIASPVSNRLLPSRLYRLYQPGLLSHPSINIDTRYFKGPVSFELCM